MSPPVAGAMLPVVSTTQRSSAPNAEEMVKDFVATRPRRPRSGKVIAGVAAGIGRRYGVDPVIVRVALVVSAVYGGAGVLFYLLGWLFLAAQGDEVSPAEALLGRGRSSTGRGLTLVLCVALIPAGSFVFGGHYSTLAGVVVLLAALYLLHRYRGDQGQIDVPPQASGPEAGQMTDSTPTSTPAPEDAVAPSAPEDAVPADAAPTERVGNLPTYGTLPGRAEPPAWDPLGAAPFAWDLPEPAVPEPPPPPARRKSRIGLATLGVLFVTAAVLGVLAPESDWLDAPHIVGILGAIAGLGLIIGAFLRSGRGLIPLALLLAAAGFGLTTTHFDGWHGAGDAHFHPTSVLDVPPVYQRSVGDITVDLTGLPDTGTVHTAVRLGVGNATVIVPKDADVQATCVASVGDVSCLGEHESGPGNPKVTASQDGGPGDRLHIFLEVTDGPGQIEVTNND
jgi:phage shock protein PspC (stress-responsive transcriptional regulator)